MTVEIEEIEGWIENNRSADPGKTGIRKETIQAIADSIFELPDLRAPMHSFIFMAIRCEISKMET